MTITSGCISVDVSMQDTEDFEKRIEIEKSFPALGFAFEMLEIMITFEHIQHTHLVICPWLVILFFVCVIFNITFSADKPKLRRIVKFSMT